MTQKVAGTNQVIIKTKELDLAGREALNEKLAESFGVDKTTITAENISGAISKEVKNDAVVSLA